MTVGTPSSSGDADLALRRRTEEIGTALQSAVNALLASIQHGGARGQKSLQLALQIGQSAVSRLSSAVRSGDPLITLGMIPGQLVLGQMLKGAARSGVDPACLARVAEAVRQFDDFVEREFGDRAALDTLLSEWVFESRAAFELRQKAAAFKSMSALRGVQADLVLSTGIVYPGSDGAAHDGMGVEVLLGCRRLKPSGRLRLNFSSLDPNESRYQPHSLAGTPVGGMRELLVPEFSTVRDSQIASVRQGRVIETSVTGLPLGKTQGRGDDIVYAQVYNGVHRARRGAGSPTSGMASHAEPPAQCCVIDALLHDDVWPGIEPQLRLYDTVVRGIAHPDDPVRFNDRLDMVESVQSLGRGVAALRLPEFVRYPELIAHLCALRGWDAGALRAYRVKIRYPIYGSQIGMAFVLPD